MSAPSCRAPFFSLRAGAVLACGLLLAGAVAGKTTEASAVAREKEPAAAAITEAECAAFGEEIARAVNEGDAAAVVEVFDPFALTARVTAGLEMKDDFRRGVINGIETNARESMRRVFDTIEKARFLRVLKVDGEFRPLVRMLTKEGGMNFHAYVVERCASGRLKWVDMHVCLAGELMSETMRRLLLPAVAEQNAGLFERLTRGEGEYMKNLPKLTEVQKKLQAGDLAGAKAILDGFPQELRRMKPILAMRLLVAQKTDEAAYLGVIKEWEACFPGDPSLALIGIDGSFLRKDYEGSLNCLAELRRYTGEDPYLDFLEASTLRLAKRHPESRAAARRCLAADPAMANAYDVLLVIELSERNHAGVAALLTEVETNYPGADMAKGIANLAEYAEFRDSPEYGRWVAGRIRQVAAPVN
ncbi:MAG TPA: hypothetical protein VK163_09640 [Opitutaceae bacterium]|nr:hypothetical protein [Opitutaceae bacterium]